MGSKRWTSAIYWKYHNLSFKKYFLWYDTAYLWQQYDAIQEQVAQGQGEHLEAIARFSGCTEPVTEIFKGELAQNYQSLFSSQGDPVALRNQIGVVIQNNEELRTSCQGSEFITS